MKIPRDMENFTVSKKEIINQLANCEISKECIIQCFDTYRNQGEARWKRGTKRKFQCSLSNANLHYFAYVKFYKGDDNKDYALVAGKSGSYLVNKSSGCDLSFSTREKDGAARRWLKNHCKQWCHTEILIIAPKDASESEKRAYKIERELLMNFDLFGS